MKQPDSQREGPAQKLDQDAAGEQPKGGREATTSGGGEPPHNTTKPATNKPNKKGGEAAPQHKRQHTKAKEKTTAKTQAEKPTDQKRHREATAKRDTRRRQQTNRARKARPKTTMPMLGTIIEQNGDGLLEQSHMPVGWPLHIDGAVRQNCFFPRVWPMSHCGSVLT